jgi:hypothetical protein
MTGVCDFLGWDSVAGLVGGGGTEIIPFGRDEKSNQHNQACQAKSCKIPQISHCRSPNLSMPAFDLPEVRLDDGLNINLGSLM